jgi:hypothetical protein
MKRLLPLFLTTALLLTGPALALDTVPAAPAPLAPDGYETAASNGRLALYADKESGRIILEDRETGFFWRSNPEGSDSKAKGVHKQTLMSQIVVSYSNERGTDLSLTSNADAVKDGGLTLLLEDDGMTAVYDFRKPRIRVRVLYSLEEDCLKVRVPVEGMECYPDEAGIPNLNTVTAVDVLPVLGAGGKEDKGWLLVPDGSGALIHFNNGVSSMQEYHAAVYGKDSGVEGQIALSGTLSQQARTQEQVARLPVFGTYHEGGNGLMGVVTGNSAKASILARVSNLTSYNYVWSRFMVRNSGSMMMNSKEFGSSVIGVSEREGLTRGEYEVRYYPLNGDKAGYAGMAARYRKYLEAEAGLARRILDNEYPLYLELYGLVKKPAHFLGIPYTKTVTLTSISDIRAILSALNIPQSVVRFSNWIEGSVYERIPSAASLSGRLGTPDEMKALAAELEGHGGGLYPAVDLINIYRGGNGFWAIRDAVLAPVNSPQMQFQTSYSTRAADPAIPPWYLLSPARYDRFYSRFFASFDQTGFNTLALDAIGDICTSDNRSGGTGRGEVSEIVRTVLLKAGKELMLDSGNAYAAVLARHLINTPGYSSGYTLQDETIPFYQIVFHGWIPYGIGDVNHASSPEAFLLHCLEYGASPQFAFIGRNAWELADSRMVWLYSPDWQAWTEEVKSGYAMLQGVLSPLSRLPITQHRNLPDHCAVTEYGGTTAVYVNYGTTDATIGDLVIPAMGYLVREVTGDAE